MSCSGCYDAVRRNGQGDRGGHNTSRKPFTPIWPLVRQILNDDRSIVIEQLIKTARRTLPALLYAPGILTWWSLVDETARVVFTSLIHGLDRSVHILVLMTAHCQYIDLPSEVDVA